MKLDNNHGCVINKMCGNAVSVPVVEYIAKQL